MIAHIILFSPKSDLPPDERRDLLASLVAASGGIPSIRRFRVGRRVTHGLPGYEQMMRDDYEFAAVIEFDDVDGAESLSGAPVTLGHRPAFHGVRLEVARLRLRDGGRGRGCPAPRVDRPTRTTPPVRQEHARTPAARFSSKNPNIPARSSLAGPRHY